MKFGPNGEINFFTNSRRADFAKVHGYWPSEDQLLKFEAGEIPAPSGKPGLNVVPGDEK